MENADEFFSHAAEDGATVKMPLADQFWGDRYGQLQDPFGHIWSVGATKKKLCEEELRKRRRLTSSKELLFRLACLSWLGLVPR